MPEEFVPWSQIRKELNAILRHEWGVLAKDIHAVEALAGTVNDSDGDGVRLLKNAKRPLVEIAIITANFHLSTGINPC